LFSSSNIDPDNQFGEFGTIRNKSFLVLEPKKDEKLFWDGNVSLNPTSLKLRRTDGPQGLVGQILFLTDRSLGFLF
jgi:hypothetical protein